MHDLRRSSACWRSALGALVGPIRREFFPEVDAGAFAMTVRAPSGTRIEVTEKRIAAVEDFLRKEIPEHDLRADRRLSWA